MKRKLMPILAYSVVIIALAGLPGQVTNAKQIYGVQVDSTEAKLPGVPGIVRERNVGGTKVNAIQIAVDDINRLESFDLNVLTQIADDQYNGSNIPPLVSIVP